MKCYSSAYSETKDGFALDMAALKAQITPKTSVFIYNNFQNPMGACSSDEEMNAIAELCVANNLWVLSDEAYFDIVFGTFMNFPICVFPFSSCAIVYSIFSLFCFSFNRTHPNNAFTSNFDICTHALNATFSQRLSPSRSSLFLACSSAPSSSIPTPSLSL